MIPDDTTSPLKDQLGFTIERDERRAAATIDFDGRRLTAARVQKAPQPTSFESAGRRRSRGASSSLGAMTTRRLS
jgi:hypothetical protein